MSGIWYSEYTWVDLIHSHRRYSSIWQIIELSNLAKRARGDFEPKRKVEKTCKEKSYEYDQFSSDQFYNWTFWSDNVILSRSN